MRHNKPTEARPKGHNFVGLVSSDEHLLLVQVQVSLQGGDHIIELILLDYQAGLDGNITVLLVIQVALEDVGKLHLARVCGSLSGKVDTHQAPSHTVHIELAMTHAAAVTGCMNTNSLSLVLHPDPPTIGILEKLDWLDFLTRLGLEFRNIGHIIIQSFFHHLLDLSHITDKVVILNIKDSTQTSHGSRILKC